MPRISHELPLEREVEEAFRQIEEQLNIVLNSSGAFLIDNIEVPSRDYAISRLTGNNVFDADRNYDEKFVQTITISGNTASDSIPYTDSTPEIGVLKVTSEFQDLLGGDASDTPQIRALVGGGFQIWNASSSTRYIRTIIRILEN